MTSSDSKSINSLKVINKALINSTISDERLALIKYLKEVGNAVYKTGDYFASYIVLKSAKELLENNISEEK